MKNVVGAWFLVLGSWFLVLGSWFLVLGSWFRKPGTRNPEPGTRNPEPGTRFFILPYLILLGARNWPTPVPRPFGAPINSQFPPVTGRP